MPKGNFHQLWDAACKEHLGIYCDLVGRCCNEEDPVHSSKRGNNRSGSRKLLLIPIHRAVTLTRSEPFA